MSLLLTGSREHALLAMLTQEAATLSQKEGGYLGRTAIQKILYFLQVLGVPMRYRFEIHHYGPYCDEVSRDVEWLIADGVAVDRSYDRSKYSNYGPGPSADELVAKHAKELEPYREAVRTIVGILLPLQPGHLELIATLDYAYRQLKASGGAGPSKEAVISRFLEIKGSKFTRDDISKVYDQMVGVKLFG
jgi:hypothetical protein